MLRFKDILIPVRDIQNTGKCIGSELNLADYN